MSSDLSETFSQISAAGQASIGNVNVSITSGGNIIGQGVTASARALDVSGGNLDAIIRSFGGDVSGIQGGGKDNIKRKVSMVMEKAKHSGSKMDSHLEKQLKSLHNHASDLEEFASLAKTALKEPECSSALHEVLGKIMSHVDSGARAMRSVLEKDLKQPKQKVAEFMARNKQFAEAISTLGAHLNEPNAAGMVSLSFSNVNELKKTGQLVSDALKAVDMKKKEFLGQSLANLDRELTHKLEDALKRGKSSASLRAFLKGWKTLLEHQGHAHTLEKFIKGAGMGDGLADRLHKSREELKNIVNKFIMAFGADLNDIVGATNELSKHLGKDIPYSDETVQFLDAFTRLNEYLNSNRSKFYQHLLEINSDQVDSKEIKARFLNNLRVLSEKAVAMGNSSSTKAFASSCDSAVQSVHKFSDLIKTFHEEMKKEGGNATDTMNELYSVDASKIEISALINPLENLQVAIKKLQFFKNIAVFRSNLSQTNKELAGYSKDYEKSVGKSIGEAISRITNEYTEIINQVSDNKSGMGLEIDMYNESLPKDQKISKEKLKTMYKWQCDARVGLYKTIEAIDLYLLHFTDAITKNPDAVSDLHKLLSATRIIARWYDQKAGQNLIRVFESFRDGVADEELEADAFIATYNGNDEFANLSAKLGGERAAKVYERCRRAVQGVVVLKNIISYFMSLGEKYGDFKGEKSIYMAPSNIYKNLVNYIWVSALDINTTGTEVLTDDNETKRLLTYEDTKVQIAQITDIDPETMGINFNRHSIDKLRILKCHNELMRLRDSTASMSDLDIRRIKQFVSGTFARLGKTKYIFPMFLFGVYDLSQMDRFQMTEFMAYVNTMLHSSTIADATRAALDGQIQAATNVRDNAQAILDAALNNPGANARDADAARIAARTALAAAQQALDDLVAQSSIQFATLANRADLPTINFVLPGAVVIPSTADNLVTDLMDLSPNDRSSVTTQVSYGFAAYRDRTFVNLKQFMTIQEGSYAAENGIISINGMASASLDRAGRRNDNQRFISTDGFLKGFLTGLTSNTSEVGSAVYAQRAMAALHYCVMNMLNTFKRTQSSSVFAIDDSYFVLAVKAIAGKVMTITGVNSLFKNPNAYRNTLSQNKTRLIMGGADSILEDPEVVDDAVELYVRLPLLMEFYRAIFDNANKGYKQESLNDIGPLDEEQISFVPELGNIWSNLIKNIFDKSKHIENGVYTPENMRKIISEVNAIYSHYKRSAPEETLTRHIIMELVAEINRRYGVIKRQELLNYYKVMNATKRGKIDVSESSYSNNDFDILNEEIEFEEKSPSDAFINLKSTLADKSVTQEVKINKLTDYKILKDFRGRINSTLNVAENDLHAGNDQTNDFLSMVDRIRMLKKAVSSKTNRDEKYDLIIKAIEESEAMNQSSNDIFACFHELVIVPMRMAYQMYKALDQFILAIYSVFGRVVAAGNPVLESNVNFNGRDMTFLAAIRAIASASEIINLTEADGLTFKYGRNIAKFADAAVALDVDTGMRRLDPTIDGGALNTGTAQILLADILSHFCQNSGNLAKMTVSTTGRITVDLSEFQTLCEYLISNTKFMIDKFTGLVPTQLIKNVTDTSRIGTIYWLEDNLVNKIFNKINKNESERAIVSIDNLNKIMPMVSNAMFNTEVNCSKLITELLLNRNEAGTAVAVAAARAAAPADRLNNPTQFGSINSELALPIIRDAFLQYDQTARIFRPSENSIGIFSVLFNPANTSSIVAQNVNHGLVQEFNTLIAHYLNDLYDAQTHKMYPKLFEKFANNAFIEALNGQAFADFAATNGSITLNARNDLDALNINFYDLPSSHGILSATLAYVMKTITTRVHPISGVKLYEAASLQEVSAHVMEKYRACLPMYLRLFSIFLERCKFYRKAIAKMNVSNAAIDITPLGLNAAAKVALGLTRENADDSFIRFASEFTSLNKAPGNVARDKALLFIDDMVNGISSIIEDASAVHKELRALDNSVPLFFDIKHNFTKSFYLNTKELPYAPLSTLTMAFNNTPNAIQPFPTTSNVGNFKFLYGLQSVLIDNFKLTTSKVPYMKKLLMDFNGYNTKINNISEDKFNDMLKYLGQAFNFYYDWKFFNGKVFGDVNMISDDLEPLNVSTNNVLRLQTNRAAQEQIMNAARADMNRIGAGNPGFDEAQQIQDAAEGAIADIDAQIVAANAAIGAVLNSNRPDAAQLAGAVLDAAIANAVVNATLIRDQVPRPYQEVQSRDASITIIESISPVDSKNKIADYVKNSIVRELERFDARNGANPRSRVIMINIVDLGIVPINIHSLMREIPLANLYNYAMTFDQFVAELDIHPTQKALLMKPYTQATVAGAAGAITVQLAAADAAGVATAPDAGIASEGTSSLRFLTDIVFTSLAKPTQQGAGYVERVNERINSKLVRNLTFLTLVQYAIKKKVKQELDFVNSRVVSDIASVSNVITTASNDVNDNLFEF